MKNSLCFTCCLTILLAGLNALAPAQEGKSTLVRMIAAGKLRQPGNSTASIPVSVGRSSPAVVVRAEKIFADDASIRKLAGGFLFTEGPAVGPDGKIYFNDIPNEKTHVYEPQTGKLSVFRENTGKANGLFWTAAGKLVACEGGNRRVTLIDGEDVEVLASSYDGKKLNSPNDLALDPDGGLFFTDPRYGNRDNMEMEIEGVYYISKSGKLTRVVDDLERPNGLIFSPDFKTLYVADQAAGKIMAYEVMGPGKLGPGKKLADFGSDGMSVDTNGNIYLTWQGAVIVLDPSGQEVDRLKFPEGPANCVLVGQTLYVTARTGFYSVPTLSTGVK